MALIAEDVLLLLLDDRTGKMTLTEYAQTVVGGALLAELALGGHVVLGEKDGFWHQAKVESVPLSPPSDPILREAYEQLARKPQPPKGVVAALGKKAVPALAQRLTEQGVLSEVHDKVLGIFPRTRWPEVDSSRERQLRADLTAVLVTGRAPDLRLATVVALLDAMGQTAKVVEADGATKAEVTRRGREIADGDWAAKAVKDAIATARSTMTIGATTATTAATVIAINS